MDTSIYCPWPDDRSVDQSRHDGHVSEMTAHVPGVAATRRDGRRIRHVHLVIAAGGHLATRRHVEQVAGKEIPPGAGLAERGQRAQDQLRVLFAKRLITEPQGRQETWPEGFQNDVRRLPPNAGTAARPSAVSRLRVMPRFDVL